MSKSHLSATLLLMALSVSQSAIAQQTLDDPMRPPHGSTMSGSGKSGASAKKDAANGYYLSSIRIAKDHRLAMINGKLLAPGQSLGDARLVDIEANHVTLQIAGKRTTLSLLPISIKKPVEAIQK